MSDFPRVLFHLTSPSTVDPDREAVHGEVSLLCDRLVAGRTLHIRGAGRPAWLPRILWGLHLVGRLRRRESEIDLHQVFNPDLFPFPYLRFLRRPIIYSAVGDVAGEPWRVRPHLARRMHVVLPTTPHRGLLQELGYASVSVIRPGVDAANFPVTPPNPGRPFTLMMGSAPWTREQFASKGIEAILEAAQRTETVHWILLWRGVLEREIERAIAERGLADRVEVRYHHVDVGRLLTEAHAGVLLATRPALVKAFPQSLLECLMAGRPIVVSSVLAMASYVRQHGCGVVVDRVSSTSLLAAVEQLQSRYDEYRQQARPSALRDFSVDAFLAGYSKLYRQVMGSPRPQGNLQR